MRLLDGKHCGNVFFEDDTAVNQFTQYLRVGA